MHPIGLLPCFTHCFVCRFKLVLQNKLINLLKAVVWPKLRTMASNILFQRNNLSIAVIEWESFLSGLPHSFQADVNGCIIHDPSVANVFMGKKKNIFVNAYRKTHKVKTVEEFELLRRRLLTLPIFLKLTLKRKGKYSNLRKKHRFMVCLNPLNPVIKTQIEEKLNNCETLMKRGKNFSFELNVGPTIQHWYRSYEGRLFRRYQSPDSVICVTNYTKRKRSCYSYRCWMAFLPVMIFAGPAYMIHRKIACTDMRCRVDGFVTPLR